MATKKAQTAPRAEYLAKLQVTDVINSFADWIESETGTTLTDRERVVLYLGSALRGEFQKSPGNAARLRAQAERVAADKAAKEKRATERKVKAAKPQPATPPSAKLVKKSTPAQPVVQQRRRALKVEATA